jgi:hypothetical protein
MNYIWNWNRQNNLMHEEDESLSAVVCYFVGRELTYHSSGHEVSYLLGYNAV